MKKKVFLLLIFGVLFRLWFISLAPQPFIDDQMQYHIYARKMMDRHFIASHSYRSYPYSLFLAILYTLFGFGNLYAVFVAQALLDSLTGLLLFMILRHSAKDKRLPRIGLLLYLVNPFTSGYVGVILSEVLAAFTIVASVASGVWFIQKSTIMRGLLFGIMTGIAAETRNASFLWALIPIILTMIFISWKRYWRAYVSVMFGVIFTLVYPLYVNWRDYGEFTVTTVDSIFAREFFNGAVLKILPPFTYSYPQEVMTMYTEYYTEQNPWRTKERRVMARKYTDKAIALIRADPFDYLRTRIFKMWYVWQKENIFFYQEPHFATHFQYTYIGNLVLLALSLVGLFLPVWRGVGKFVRLCIVGSLFYGTLAFSITHAEYRLTIPYYPLLIVSASVAISTFWSLFSIKISKKNESK